MRRLFPLISLLCVLATASFAQMHGGFRGGGGGFRGGGSHGGGFHGGGFHGGGFHGGFRAPAFRSGFGGGSFFSPSIYPAFWDWGWDSSFNSYASSPYSYSPQPNVVVVYPPPSQPAPPVVIQQYVPPARERETTPPPDPDPTPIFSLAFKDHSVSQAAAYWVVGGTLHYVTTEGKRYAVPLAQVDRPTSIKLNQNRGVAFGLPS